MFLSAVPAFQVLPAWCVPRPGERAKLPRALRGKVPVVGSVMPSSTLPFSSGGARSGKVPGLPAVLDA